MADSLNQTELNLTRTRIAIERLVERVNTVFQDSLPLHELESELLAEFKAVGRACTLDYIEGSGDGDVGPQVTVAGEIAKRSDEKHSRRYRSIFGEFEIKRFVYCRRKKTQALAKPLDQKLGLPADDLSYMLEDWLGYLSASVSFAVAVDWLEKTWGITVPASMAHRRAQRLGSFVEEFNEQRKPVAADSEEEVLVAQADGKGVPVRESFEQRAHDALGKPLAQRPKPDKDYEKSDYRHVLGDRKTQRATSGAFYSIANNPRTAAEVLNGNSASKVPPINKRLWSEMNMIIGEEVSRGVVRVFESLAAERDGRDPDHKKTMVCVMDGDRHLWSMCQEYLPGAIEVLDLFHVMERLWLASQCFHREASVEAEEWVARHLEMLLENKVDSLRGVLKREINKAILSETKLGHLKSVYSYFTVNRERMRYGDYLAAGYPIGSGVIEGACKHVVGDRMCCTGMTWHYEGAQQVLDLRVTKLNDQWPEFIEYRIQSEQNQLYHQAA